MMQINRAKTRAFSLVEIMVVLVIIGLLAGAVTLSVSSFMTSAKRNTARQELATIAEALDIYYTVHGRYPDNSEGLSVLRQSSEQFDVPLLEQEPIDPWGNLYQYNQPGRNGAAFEVFTLGADGREGGEGVDADLGTWNLKRGSDES